MYLEQEVGVIQQCSCLALSLFGVTSSSRSTSCLFVFSDQMFVCGTFCRSSALQLLRLFSTKPLPVLTLFTKVTNPLLLLRPFVLQQVDISLPENRLWWDRYRWDIPVFHLNGLFVMKHRVDAALLDRLLQDIELRHV
uniref:Glutaredoxin-like protein n=1 Tax=Oryzias melastigma TaxID=30732 RepID=A0A3B3CMY0_ORYME